MHSARVQLGFQMEGCSYLEGEGQGAKNVTFNTFLAIHFSATSSGDIFIGFLLRISLSYRNDILTYRCSHGGKFLWALMHPSQPLSLRRGSIIRKSCRSCLPFISSGVIDSMATGQTESMYNKTCCSLLSCWRSLLE